MVRLRQVDVKAEHFERQVQRMEQERDLWEKKYEVSSIVNLELNRADGDATNRKSESSIRNRRTSWKLSHERWKGFRQADTLPFFFNDSERMSTEFLRTTYKIT